MKNIIAYSTNSYHGFTIDQALEGIATAGFEYVELCAVRGWTEHIMPDMPETEIERIREKMESLGLKPIGLSGHCNLMDKERLKDFENNIELAHRLGIKNIISSTGEAHFGENEEFSDNILVVNINSLIPLLEKYGMVMTLEIHGEYGSGEQLYRLTRKIDSAFVGINYDTANVVLYTQISPLDDVKKCVDDIKYVHLKDKIGMNADWNLPPVGKGELDLEAFMQYLDCHDYSGVYSIEVEYDKDFCMREKDQPGDIERADQAARDAYAFMKSINRL